MKIEGLGGNGVSILGGNGVNGVNGVSEGV